MLDDFRKYLEEQGKSQNTIESYIRHINGFLSWYKGSFEENFKQLLRMNVRDYIGYMKNVKRTKDKNKPINAKTINATISALIKFNEYLCDNGIQKDIVVNKKDTLKVQQEVASPANLNKTDVEKFRQKILIEETFRDYAIITVMAYAGLRISEVIELRLDDVNLHTREILVRDGKGSKQRLVYINDKIVDSIKEYLKERDSLSMYLFVSRQSEKLNRTRVNQIFNKHSNTITPHSLRHFYCSNALEAGYSVAEVANQAGHKSIQTTMIYTNPSREKMKEKSNLL